MMAAQLAPIGLDDVLVAGRHRRLEHPIGLAELLRRIARGLAREAATADAQRSLDVRKLDARDTELACDAHQKRAHRAAQIVAGNGGANLDLKEDMQKIGASRAGLTQERKIRIEIEARVFAGREAFDGRAHLRGIQAELAHDGARSGDLPLRDPPVGLCEVTHDAEGDAEELLADGLGRQHRRLARGFIELMAEKHAQERAERPESHQAHHPTHDFARPALHACYSTSGYRSTPARTATLMPTATIHRTQLRGLEKIYEGKVRDLYAVDAQYVLMVTTDRLSAFDVVLPDPIPDKGRVLNAISNFWFAKTASLVPNHLSGRPLASAVRDAEELALLEGRAVIAKRLQALPIEAVVRGYLIGSGWKDYVRTGSLCGIALPAGLKLAERLPQPLFTPATKAASGKHDENISFANVERLLGARIAGQVRATSLALYELAAAHARERGIIIADTKFEFGLDDAGELTLMDEVLTPDSSRFWPAEHYTAGISPPSFDKQFVRDYLETLTWDKKAPGPKLPPDIIARTSEKYREALARLT